MAQTSRFWDGTTVGDAASYTDTEWAETELWKFTKGEYRQGVINSRANNLLPYAYAAAVVGIASGAALVGGRLYVNDSLVQVAVSGNAKWWIIGLFSDVSAHTIRVFGRGNYATEALALASLVLGDGGASDNEIPIATVLTTAGGDISTITDHRYYAIRSFFNEFIPAINGRNITGASDIDRDDLGVPLVDAAVCVAYGQHLVKRNYYFGITITPLVISDVAGNAYMNTDVMHEQIGEGSWQAHSNSTTYIAEAITNSLVEGLTSVAITNADEGGGNLLCLATTRDATNILDTVNGGVVYVCGWNITYNVLY